MLLWLERYKESVEAFDQALAIDPNYEKAKSYRATAENKQKAFEIKEQGNALFKKEKYPEALQKYDEAVSVCPELKSAWLNKGHTHKLLEQFDDAPGPPHEELT